MEDEYKVLFYVKNPHNNIEVSTILFNVKNPHNNREQDKIY